MSCHPDGERTVKSHFSVVHLCLVILPHMRKTGGSNKKWWRVWVIVLYTGEKHLVCCPFEWKASLYWLSCWVKSIWLAPSALHQSEGSESLFCMCVRAPGEEKAWTGQDMSFSLCGQPGPSVRQSVQEPVNQRRGRYQVLQLQVKDSLKALGPLGTELCPYTQNTTQRGRSLGRGGRRATTQVVSETTNYFILQLINSLWVLQTWDLFCG